jgi:hypothetical protein
MKQAGFKACEEPSGSDLPSHGGEHDVGMARFGLGGITFKTAATDLQQLGDVSPGKWDVSHRDIVPAIGVESLQ